MYRDKYWKVTCIGPYIRREGIRVNVRITKRISIVIIPGKFLSRALISRLAERTKERLPYEQR